MPEGTLGLTLEDVSCTEAWLHLKTTNLQLPNNITLFINDRPERSFNLITADTLLYIDSLLPNRNYSFQIYSFYNPEDGIKSNKVSPKTMDTTSHNFTWQTFEFGESSSSTLYDVAIIDENNIWAVGEIYMNDSLGNPDPINYNAIHWNGQSWELKRVQTLFRGNLITVPLEGIYTFSSTDIWMIGSLPIHGDGTNWTMYDLRTTVDPNLSLSKCWGTNSNDMYFVGSAGSIAHYNGNSWQKLESGTTSIINDVLGIINEQNKTIIYCPAASFFTVNDKKILKIVDGKVDSINWNRDVRLYSAWAQDENFLYVCGEGVYINKFGNWNEIVLQPVGTNSIRGNGINDIFIDGDYGFMVHFNGLNWHIYNNNYLKGYSRLSIEGDIVAIAGNYQGKAIIEIGRRD